MIKLDSIIKNTVISFLAKGLSLISTILLSFAYGHYLGAFAFGELFFAITFVYMIGTLVDGFWNQIVRDVAQKPENAALYFSNVLLIKLSVWLIIYPVLLLISWLLGYSFEVRTLIAICGIDLLLNVIGNTFSPVQYALGRAIFPTTGVIVEKAFVSLLAIILLRAGARVEVVAVLIVSGSFLNTIWVAFWYFRLVGTRFVIDRKLIVKLVRADVPFLISSVLMVGTSSIDTVIISLIMNNTVVGLYGAASRIADATNVIPSVVMMIVMYPIISKLAATSDGQLKSALEKSMNILLFCAMPIATLMVVASSKIIEAIYGNGFIGAVPTLQMYGPNVLLLYINYVLVTVVLSKRKDKFIPISGGIALLSNIVLNLILIQYFQQTGSALAATLTEFLIFCLNVFIIPRTLLPLGSLKAALKALIASLLMAIVVIALHTLNIFVLLTLAMFVYFGASLLIGTIPREDYLAIYRSIRKKEQRSLDQNISDLSEGIVPIFDLPTMLIPAYNRGSLLDVEFAITGQLPMIRLPLAMQRTGLATKNSWKTQVPSYSLPVTPAPAYLAHNTDRLSDIEILTTATLPAIRLQSQSGEGETVRSGALPDTFVISVGTARTDIPDGKKHNGNIGGWDR